MRLIAVLDLDGVLTNALDYVDEVGRRTGLDYIRGERLICYRVEDMWPHIPTAVWHDVFWDEEFVRGMKPLPGAVEGVRELHDMGYMVVVLTDRPAHLYHVTSVWLGENGMGCAPVLFTKGRKKREFVEWLDSSVGMVLLFVDDNPRHVESVRAMGSGIVSLLYGWRYNGGHVTWDSVLEVARRRLSAV